jgi:hypothetical protein
VRSSSPAGEPRVQVDNITSAVRLDWCCKEWTKLVFVFNFIAQCHCYHLISFNYII